MKDADGINKPILIASGLDLIFPVLVERGLYGGGVFVCVYKNAVSIQDQQCFFFPLADWN